MTNKLIQYAGNKQFLVHTVNKLIQEYLPDYKVYVEPFLGSGAIFYNLENFDRTYILCDIDKHIIGMHSALLKYSYSDYMYCINNVLEHYGNIKTDKQAYYNFRNHWNEVHLNHNIKYKYLYLIMLANSCINSMLRFGKNGMNQGFGHRHYIIPKDAYESMKTRLNYAYINQTDYSSTFNNISTRKSAVYFLDPPYEDRQMAYHCGFSKQTFVNQLRFLDKSKDCLYMYTDIENSVSDLLLEHGWIKQEIRTMRTTCPSKHSEVTAKEVLYLLKT